LDHLNGFEHALRAWLNSLTARVADVERLGHFTKASHDVRRPDRRQ
jgi:hypothetical protein